MADMTLLSHHCRTVNATTIPRLLAAGAGSSADGTSIDLSSAENWLMRPESVARMTQAAALAGLTQQSLSYAEGIGGPLATRNAIASLLNSYFRPAVSVTPGQMVLAAGASAALTVLVEQVCDPGDAVLLETPYWSGLDLCLQERNGVRVVEVVTQSWESQPHSTLIGNNPEPHAVKAEDEGVTQLIKGYQEALNTARSEGVQVKAIVLCNPTNPTGVCYSPTQLSALLAFCAREDLHLVSDEVFALSVHGKAKFVSVLSVDASKVETTPGQTIDMRSRVHIVYSLSKDFGCSGIRLGAIVTQSNIPVLFACALALQTQVSIFTALIAANTLLEPSTVSEFQTTNVARLATAYQLVKEFLTNVAVPFVAAEAGVYVFAKLCRGEETSWETEKAMLQRLRYHGVNLASGRDYHCQSPGWFRIAFAFPQDVMLTAFSRITDAMRDMEDEPQGSPPTQ